MSKFEQFKEVKQQYEDFRKSVTTKFLKEVIKELGEKHGDFAIIIKGYTPSFNDGEPCEHSSNYSLCVGYRKSSYCETLWFNYDDCEATEDDSYIEFLEINTESMTSINSKFEGSAEFLGDMSLLEDIVSEALYTNYEVKIKYKGGDTVFEQDDYECGY